MESKFSLSPSHSPSPDMGNVRMNLEDEFSQEEPKQSDNMSVFARIRPMLQREEDAGYKECIGAIDDETIRAVVPLSSAKFKNTNHSGNSIYEDFKYSKAFGPETGQFLFFEETIMKTMQSFIDGQNCLIFSYGITNSGKTYTLQGTEENPGIIILALRLFFSAIEHQLLDKAYVKPEKFADLTALTEAEMIKEVAIKDSLIKFYNQEVVNKSVDTSTSMTKSFAMKLCDCFSNGFKLDIETTLPPDEMEAAQSAQVMKMLSKESADQQMGKCNIWVSFIEIYNEYIYDLLQPNVFPRKKLQLAEDQNGDVYVKGAREVYVSNVEEALKLLHVGRKSLRIACTKLNYQSSRSHCIYILKVVRLDEESSSFRINRLSFCDLAGSERASKSETSGMRLKEACYINTSLLVLGRCLEQLRVNQNSKDKKQMVPFRESKLTRLFSGHFMGKGNAVMIACASPCEYSFDETLNVLKFSAVAKELILNDTYMKMASSSLQSISSQWAESRAQVSNYSLDQSSDMDNSLLEDLQTKDEMIEKLLDLADSLRSNLDQEKKEKANLEYTIRQEVYRDYASYSDELLEKQKEFYESQLEDFKEDYDKRFEDLERSKNDTIKELRQQIAELEASSDESFQSINASISSPFKNCIKETSENAEISMSEDIKGTRISGFANGEKPSAGDASSKGLEQYIEENKVLKLDLCSVKNQLEQSSIELQKSSEEIAKLQNELNEYEVKLENVSDLKCDHLPEIEKLTSDLISLKEDLNIVTSERDSTKEELEQMSLLLQESETSKSAAEDKNLHLNAKLQESLNVLEQFEKDVASLRSDVTIAETKIAELSEERQKLKDTVFSLSEELASSTEQTGKLQSEKLDLETRLATLEENLEVANGENEHLEKSLEETTNASNELKSKILTLESEIETYKDKSPSLCVKCPSLEEEIASSNELIEQLKNEKTSVENSLATTKESLAGAEDKHNELNQKLENSALALQEQTAKIFALESEAEAYKNESSNLFAKCKSLEEEISSMSQNFESLQSEKETAKMANEALINSLNTDLVASENKFSEIKMKLEEANGLLKSKEIAFDQLTEEHATLQQKITEVENNLSSLESVHGEKCNLELSGLEQKLSDVQKLLEEQESVCAALKSDNIKLLEDNELLKNELNSKASDSFNSEAEIVFGSDDTEIETYKIELSKKESEFEALNNKYNEVLNTHHKLEEEIVVLTGKLETVVKDLEKLEKEKVVVEESLANSATDFHNVSSDLKQKEIELQSLQSENAQFKEEIAELKKEKSDLQDESVDLLNKLDAAKAEFADLERKHSDTVSNLESLDSTLKKVQTELEKSEKEKNLLEENYSTVLAKSNDESLLREQIEKLNLKIEETSSQLAQLRDQNSALNAELTSKDEQALKLNDAIKTLEERISSLSEQLALTEEQLAQTKNVKQAELEREKKALEHTLEQKNSEIESLKVQGENYERDASKLTEENDELKIKSLDLSTKLDAANKEVDDLSQKLLKATDSLEIMKSKLSDLQAVDEEKNLLEEKYSALMENSDFIAEQMKNLKKEKEDKEKALEEYKGLIEVLELNELKASEKIESLKVEHETHLNDINDMERQIREKELAISELEKALHESQKRVKELNMENQKLEKSKKKTSSTKAKDICDNKENAKEHESSKDKLLKRNSSSTSEENFKSEEPKKTRRALRARQPDSTTVMAYESDEDEKPKTASRKRKSDEEFLPTKKVQKEAPKLRKIPSRRGLKDKKEDLKVQNENMSPVQKVAAFVGSTFRSVANTVSNIPSPRMTRGRRKLFNVDSAGSSVKKWNY